MSDSRGHAGPRRSAPDWPLQGELAMCPCGCIGKRKKGSFVEWNLGGGARLMRQVMFSEDVAGQEGLLQRVDPRAKIVALNPDVLLFDEPTAALDPRTQGWLIDLIGELNQPGKTIILATHDLELLGEVADRCLVFGEDHTVARMGKPEEILGDTDLLLEHRHRHAGSGADEHGHPPRG